MFKKSMSVLMIAILAISCMFISCENGNMDPGKTASLDLRACTMGQNAKSLNRKPLSFDANGYYWKYTAVKTDGTAFKTGECEDIPVKTDPNEKGLGSVGPFSLGSWSFTLKAYLDNAYEKLVYTGTNNLVVKQGSNSISIIVDTISDPLVKGFVKIPANINIKTTGGDMLSGATANAVTFLQNGHEISEQPIANKTGAFNEYALVPGEYEVRIAYGVESAEGIIENAYDSIIVQVYSNLTTEIGGMLEESDGQVVLNSQVAIKNAEKTITANTGAATVFEVDITPTAESASNKTVLNVPQGKLNGEVKASVTTYPAPAADEKFVVVTGDEIVGALDITITQGNNEITDFNDSPITVTTYVGTGLGTASDIKVKHNASDGRVEEIVPTSYNNVTGELVFQVKHLSEYYIVSTAASVYNVNKGAAYNSFGDAIADVSAGDNLVLLKDVTVDQNTRYMNSVNIDFDGRGHKITVIENKGKPSDAYDPYWLFHSFTGKIRNLNYVTLGNKMLVEEGYSLTYENVNTYGDMGGDCNIAPFLAYPMSGDFRFTNCVNHANIIADGGDTRGAAFIGYYPLDASSKFTFENCDNYGHLKFATGAAMFFGNATKTYYENYTITNCHNYGTIEAFGSGKPFYGAGGIDWKDVEGKDKYNASTEDGVKGEIKVWGVNPKSFSVNNDGTPVYDITNPELYNISYKVKYYISFTNKSGSHPGLTVDVPVDLVDGKLPTGFVIVDNPETHNTVINGILQIDPWVQTAFPKGEHTDASVKSLDYLIILTEKETGNVVGQRGCNISQ